MGEVLKNRLKQDSFTGEVQEAVLNLQVVSYYLRNDLNDLFKESGLTRGQHNVLRILGGAYPEGHARCDIIDRMVEPAPDVTRLIDRLVDGGYVKRHRCKEDARKSIATITERGLKMVEEARPKLEAFAESIGDSLTKGECKKLSELCEKIYAERVE
jgi:DNA-binding MarR family transcriptional regulator